MNKQQLANKIWESANKMRSKIEANEYKDYILGFIFYKFLSDREVALLQRDGYGEEDISSEVREENSQLVDYCQRELGYFIACENLFSTWLAKGSGFTVDDVRTALSAFNRLISETQKKVFGRIFNTLETGLSKLGDSTGNQTKAIRDLIQLIKDIPTDGRQDYDVLGFIYEYLISNFAANAGKKAGEFYTPHEVSQLMSEIVANHLRDRDKIEIYDPTSGSGSLLITIGKSAAKYIKGRDSIKYYAQEWKENTYNLTRMNLVMRGIRPDNIFARCGDTLEEDWPWFDDTDPSGTYHPLYLDAVVSNPPYSQHWDPSNKDTDPRYRCGMAPRSKADYAFLLHDLYHIKPDGIMAIVLPHGVLFRGDAVGGADGLGEGEGRIRRNLVENNNIEAIIGLPPNIFYGTGIPTIIMVLRQKREETDILIIDASRGFKKAGKNNKLMASDIKRIVDAVAARPPHIEKFARLVSREEIRRNGYNLNIPRYIDSSEPSETWDMYASMFGGIPNGEIDLLQKYWETFPGLRGLLFFCDGTPYSSLTGRRLREAVEDSRDVKAFFSAYRAAFADFDACLNRELIENMMELNISAAGDAVTRDIFRRVAPFALIDKYQAYQLLDDRWGGISADLEMLQTEGFEAARQVDPNMVIRKKGDGDEEVQNGWVGHIIPFELVQTTLLREDYEAVRAKRARLEEIAAQLAELIDSIDEADRGDFLNDENTAFVAKRFAAKLEEIYADIPQPEHAGLQGYLRLLDGGAGRARRLAYIAEHREVNWDALKGTAPYGRAGVVAYRKRLEAAYEFPRDSLEDKLVRAQRLTEEEKQVKRKVKDLEDELHLKTKDTIETLEDGQVLDLLRLKWIEPLCASLRAMPEAVADGLERAVLALADKYAAPYRELELREEAVKQELCQMIGRLRGSECDLAALRAFRAALLGPEAGAAARDSRAALPAGSDVDAWDSRTVLPAGSDAGASDSRAALPADSGVGAWDSRAVLPAGSDAAAGKLFPQDGSRIPALRFEGFSGPWNRSRFDSLYRKVSEKNDLRYGEDKIISVANMYFKADVSISDAEYLRTYNVFQLGDIAFEGNKSRNFAHGRFVENTIGDGIVSHVFDVFRPVMESYDLLFWKYAINNEQVMKSILVRCTKASTMMTNLVADDFLQEYFQYPDIEEQREIGRFLSLLDEYSSVCQSKLEKLQNMKNTMLSGLFV